MFIFDHQQMGVKPVPQLLLDRVRHRRTPRPLLDRLQQRLGLLMFLHKSRRCGLQRGAQRLVLQRGQRLRDRRFIQTDRWRQLLGAEQRIQPCAQLCWSARYEVALRITPDVSVRGHSRYSVDEQVEISTFAIALLFSLLIMRRNPDW